MLTPVGPPADIRSTWLLLLAVTAALSAANATDLGTSWHLFDLGGRLLVGADADSLYAAHPDLQIGPLALLAAAPSRRSARIWAGRSPAPRRSSGDSGFYTSSLVCATGRSTARRCCSAGSPSWSVGRTLPWQPAI